MVRERRFNAVVGIKGSGKSTFLAGVAKKYRGNVCIAKHIININDLAFKDFPVKTMANWRQGARPDQPVKFKVGIDEDSYKDLIDWVRKGQFKNGLLIVDDATLYEENDMSKGLKNLITLCRHHGIDLWVVYHGLTLFPIRQFVFLDYLVLFNNTDSFDYKRNKIPKADEINRALVKARINHNSKDKKVKYTPVILSMTA